MHFSTTSALCLTLSIVSAFPRHHIRANGPCYQDNPLRALQRYSSEASVFCPKYLASGTAAIPSPLVQWAGARISSACSCYEKTADTTGPTSAPTAATPMPGPVTPTTTPTSASSPNSVPPVSSPSVVSASQPVQPSSSATKPTSISTPAAAPTGGNINSNSGTAKRGLVYDANSKSAYADFFTRSQYVNFGSNWGDTRSTYNGVTIPYSYAFVPTLKVDGQLQNDEWAGTVAAAIKSGTKYLFASNEPDNAGQANLSPQDTAKVYKKYMQPFQGQALLATPAVTNGGGETGLGFLADFLDNCADCHFDMINIHHYMQRQYTNVDQAVAALKSYIEKDVPALQAKYKNVANLPIMVGEFWLWDASEAEGGTYLEQMMPYLDCNKNIIGYQAFGGLWTNNFIKGDGSGLTPAGDAYKNYYKAESTCS